MSSLMPLLSIGTLLLATIFLLLVATGLLVLRQMSLGGIVGDFQKSRLVRPLAGILCLASIVGAGYLIVLARKHQPFWPPSTAVNPPGPPPEQHLPFADNFEREDLLQSGWRYGDCSSATITDREHHSGRRSMRIVGPCTTWLFIRSEDCQGRRVRISAWIKPVKIPAPGPLMEPYCAGHFQLSYNTPLGEASTTMYIPPDERDQVFNSGQLNAEWQERSWTGTVAQDAYYVNVFTGVQKTIGTLYVDDVSVEVVDQ